MANYVSGLVLRIFFRIVLRIAPRFLLTLLTFLPIGVSAVGVDISARTITISLQSEPPNLDSSLSQDTTSGLIIGLTNEGLVRIGPRGEIVPAVAESWELSETEAIFHLRDSAMWQDGKTVRAQDFVYSWRRLVDPKTAAAGSTFFTYTLANAQAILAGKLPKEALGVTAVDDKTLKVSLSHPVPYLLTIMAGTAYLPLRQDFVEAQGGRFGADAENLLSNGPFIMDEWTHNSSIKLRKSPTFWKQSSIQFSGIEVGYITSDVRSLLNVYKSHELAALRLSEEILGDAMNSGLKIKKAPTNCLAWLYLNLEPGRVTANKKIRQAIRLGFDRDRYVNNVVGLPGTRKIDSIFTNRIKGVKSNFQREQPAPPIEFDVAKGKALLEEARQEMGVAKIPPIVLLANESRQIEAEFIQAQLGSALGLEIRVDKQTFKQAIAKMYAHDFDLARAGFCSGAIRDPVFFAGIFVSGGPFNNIAYSSARYDELMSVTHNTADQVIRIDAFGKMQQLLYDDIPIIPTHESSYVYLQDDRVSGLARYPAVNFSRGYIH
jgi:oligopeptide transport system substrate-binding protein